MILDDLVRATRQNLNKRIAQKDFKTLQAEVEAELTPESTVFPFEKALATPQLSVIAEIKQASPSKGQIVSTDQFDYVTIATEYEAAQVAAISVLTEEDYFKGSLAILEAVTKTVTHTPVLRKDFTIDPYMIYEAKAAGAAIILLIVSILADDELHRYLQLADHLGLSAIVEAHNEEEVQRGLKAGARIIGVNNRNLKNFTIDMANTARLRDSIPADIFLISESGITLQTDLTPLKEAGLDGILVGETLMKSQNKVAAIEQLIR